MTRPGSSRLERLATGIPDLDELIEGGWPIGSTTIIAGASGTGKTALCLQTMFNAARSGRKCLYLTTLSEPAPKVMRYMQRYRFFDATLLDEHITLLDLGTPLRERGGDAALAQIVEHMESERPDLLVIDSFKAIHDVVPTQRYRGFVYELAVNTAGWGATSLLVGEYIEEELTLPEFAIADGIVFLGSTRRDLALVRQLEVRKLRGSGFATGVHFYDLGADGVTFYPRVRAPSDPDAAAFAPSEVITTGVEGLDPLFGGGIPRASSTVVMGGSGTGKTMLALGFVREGVRRREPSLLMLLEETPGQIRGLLRRHVDVDDLEREGLLRLVYSSPVEISPDRFLRDALREVASIGARRVVLDSLTTLGLGATSERRHRELVYALTKHMRSRGATLLMTMEIPEVLGHAQVAGYGISFAADNVIYLRHFERAGRLERAMSIVKARGLQHSNDIRAMTIGDGGVRIGAPLRDLEGTLSGSPTAARGDDGARSR